MSNAFPSHSGCPVPSVIAIDGSLVSSCEITPPPAPQFCFPFENIPIIPPPSFNFGCYPIGGITGGAHYNNCLVVAALSLHIGPGPLTQPIAGNMLAAIGSDVIKAAIAKCSGFSFTGDVKYPQFAETGYCVPSFNFDLGIPCIPITFAKGKVEFLDAGEELNVEVTGGRTISVTASSITMPCEYKFNLNAQIPCPDFGITTIVTEDNLIVDLIGEVEDLGPPDACEPTLTLTLKLGLTVCLCLLRDVTLVGTSLTKTFRKLCFDKGVLVSYIDGSPCADDI